MKFITTCFMIFIFFSMLSANSISGDNNIDFDESSAKSRYVENELIIKFKDNIDLGEVAGDLFDKQQHFESLSDDPYLDHLNRKIPPKKMRKAFSRALPKRHRVVGKISKYRAATIHSIYHLAAGGNHMKIYGA